ncbi:hypothetical protein M9H77_18799 [Catharanthus roseus]|uniref:Uncharacterized protein n=1 Tax=Catharanthus roseus TaxID=4058 RepID=A0ACC0B8F1_CATRO|nr:hypothetical protein M9H77_18799 [Catharanthus roseus]
MLSLIDRKGEEEVELHRSVLEFSLEEVYYTIYQADNSFTFTEANLLLWVSEDFHKFTPFNISRTLKQNAIKLLHKWQFVAPRVPRDLSISARFSISSAVFMAFS